jgi:hypothetical protein
VRVRILPRGGPASQLFDLETLHTPPELYAPQFLCGLTEHDLHDLEFVLAQRRAMSKRCTAEHSEHTCSLAPGHIPDAGHLCRACTETWPVTET